MKNISKYGQIKPYITRDGSEIRELMHPDSHDSKQQSLAEATIRPGKQTLLHRHNKSEELYFITQGIGRLQIGNEIIKVRPGDCVCIAPGMAHRIENIGHEDLKILCCCAPAYSHNDTELLQTGDND